MSDIFAGSKKSETVETRKAIAYAYWSPRSTTKGMLSTRHARTMSEITMVHFRSQRSTHAPASIPKSAAGSMVMPSMIPIWSIEPVTE